VIAQKRSSVAPAALRARRRRTPSSSFALSDARRALRGHVGGLAARARPKALALPRRVAVSSARRTWTSGPRRWRRRALEGPVEPATSSTSGAASRASARRTRIVSSTRPRHGHDVRPASGRGSGGADRVAPRLARGGAPAGAYTMISAGRGRSPGASSTSSPRLADGRVLTGADERDFATRDARGSVGAGARCSVSRGAPSPTAREVRILGRFSPTSKPSKIVILPPSRARRPIARDRLARRRRAVEGRALPAGACGRRAATSRRSSANGPLQMPPGRDPLFSGSGFFPRGRRSRSTHRPRERGHCIGSSTSRPAPRDPLRVPTRRRGRFLCVTEWDGRADHLHGRGRRWVATDREANANPANLFLGGPPPVGAHFPFAFRQVASTASPAPSPVNAQPDINGNVQLEIPRTTTVLGLTPSRYAHGEARPLAGRRARDDDGFFGKIFEASGREPGSRPDSASNRSSRRSSARRNSRRRLTASSRTPKWRGRAITSTRSTKRPPGRGWLPGGGLPGAPPTRTSRHGLRRPRGRELPAPGRGRRRRPPTTTRTSATLVRPRSGLRPALRGT